MTKAPMCRSAGARTASTVNATTATSTTAVPNSYMLPQGSRSVASPRVTRTAAWVSAPRIVRAIAAMPHRCPVAGSAADPSPANSSTSDSTSGAPPPAATRAGAEAARRPKASWAQKATTASEYSATLIEKKLSDRADSVGSVTRTSGCGARGGQALVGRGLVQRTAQVVGQCGEPRRVLATTAHERSDRQHGTAALGILRHPSEHPLTTQQQHAEQAGEQRDGGGEHPDLARVVGQLQRGELAVAGEGDRGAVGQGERLAHRQIGRPDAVEPAAVD